MVSWKSHAPEPAWIRAFGTINENSVCIAAIAGRLNFAWSSRQISKPGHNGAAASAKTIDQTGRISA
jgi:hypothetical protein